MSTLLKEFEAIAAERPLTEEELSRLLQLQDEAETARLALDRESRTYQKVEAAAEQLLLDQMRKFKHLSIRATGVACTLNPPKSKPHVQDWAKFYEYIRESNDFSFLERRVSNKAIQERWDDNVVVPGVEKFPVYTLSKTHNP